MMVMECDRSTCEQTRSLACEEDTDDWLVLHGMKDEAWAKHFCSINCLLSEMAGLTIPDGMAS